MGDKDVALYLLNAIGKKDVLILFGSVFLLSILDMLGIAAILPFLNVITKPEIVKNFFESINSFNFVLTYEELILILGSGLILFYAIKTIIQSLLIRIQAQKLARFTEEMTNLVVSDLLNARYAIFQDIAASQISGTAYSNTVHSSLALSALIQIANEALVLVFMLITFFVLQPVLALIAIVLAMLTGFFLYQVVIKRSAQFGTTQSKIENARYRLLFSIASAIRDIKIMGLDSLFNVNNRKLSHEYADIAWRYNFNTSLPRLLIEFIALFVIVTGALSIVIFNIPYKEAGPLLGLIAVATLRVVPAFSRLFGGISSFKNSSRFTKDLIGLREKLAAVAVFREEDNLKFEHKIELKNIQFSYGDKKILENINLELKSGESIGIVGLSGAGKTTLLDLFTGLQPASEGQFFCDGVEFNPFASQAIQKLIGYVPQAITLLDATIAFNVSFEEKPNYSQVLHSLKMANLHGLIDSLPEGMQTEVGENGLRLSGGQRQRIGIARALYRKPKILVFDEATSSLDTHSEMELTTEIEKLHGEVSFVIVAHRLSTVMNCDRIYVLEKGKIENCGTHIELLLKSKIYKKLYTSQRENNYEESVAIL